MYINMYIYVYIYIYMYIYMCMYVYVYINPKIPANIYLFKVNNKKTIPHLFLVFLLLTLNK